MNNIGKFVLVGMAGLASLVWTAAQAAPPKLMFDGKIVAVDTEKLVLAGGAEQPEFVLEKATKITLNGKQATVAELMAGQTVKISAQRDETKLRALEIMAFSPQ